MKLCLSDGIYTGEASHFFVLNNGAGGLDGSQSDKRDRAKLNGTDAVTELHLIDNEDMEYLTLFENQSKIIRTQTRKDSYNRIFWSQKFLLYFPLGLFVCAPLVKCVSDEYVKTFIYLGVGASFIACMEAFKFFRKDLKLAKKIFQYTDEEKKYSEKRVNYLISKRPK